jgi:hypothetical protein
LTAFSTVSANSGHSLSARRRGQIDPRWRQATLLQRCMRGGILRDAGGKRFRFSCREPLMPFKLHSKGRRHIPRQRHRVTNWREYDVCLRNRGSLTIWFTPDAIALEGPTSNNAGRSASLFEPCHRNRADFANGVSIGASPERRVDWLDHANAGDRPARS